MNTRMITNVMVYMEQVPKRDIKPLEILEGK